MCCWDNVTATHFTATDVVSEIKSLQKDKSKASSLRNAQTVAGINNAVCAPSCWEVFCFLTAWVSSSCRFWTSISMDRDAVKLGCSINAKIYHSIARPVDIERVL